MQCIGEAFGVDPADEAQKEQYSTKPANLLSIFEVYLKTKKNTAAKVNFCSRLFYVTDASFFFSIVICSCPQGRNCKNDIL